MGSFSTIGGGLSQLSSYELGRAASWTGPPSTLSLLGSSLLASGLLFPSSVESFPPVSFISLQSSYSWYLKLSQFETVFLALIMIQICFFRYLEVLPINLNNLFVGDPSGRKRRRKRENQSNKKQIFECDSDILVPSLLKVLKKLDDGNCISRTLCEMEAMNNDKSFKCGNQTSLELPNETKLLLKSLKAFAKYRHKWKHSQSQINPDKNGDASQDVIHTISSCPGLEGLQAYEDAVALGSSSSDLYNSSICEQKYSACPLTKEDIVQYLSVLANANML